MIAQPYMWKGIYCTWNKLPSLHEVEGGGSRDRIQVMWNLADSRLWLIDNWVIMGFQWMVHWWVPGEIQFFLSILWKLIKMIKMEQNYSNLHRKRTLNPKFLVKKRQKFERKKFHQSHTYICGLDIINQRKK